MMARLKFMKQEKRLDFIIMELGVHSSMSKKRVEIGIDDGG